MTLELPVKIRKIRTKDRLWVKEFWSEHWAGDFVLSRGKVHRPDELDGFVAEINDEKVGLITYKIANQELEIISFNSIIERKGIGAALLSKVVNFAHKKELNRVWLVTTNDNLCALRFYQKRGFKLVNIYPDAVEAYRKLKPRIPLIGEDGIPLCDEIELEMKF